jgi:protein-tyrosine phosphatase
VTPSFEVLHVCLGNICRSPMAERLLAAQVARALGPAADAIRSVSAGTGDWHIGEDMNPPAARQLRARGADAEGFAARFLTPEMVSSAQLILVAGPEHARQVLEYDPSAAPKTFLLRQFALLAASQGLDTPESTSPQKRLAALAAAAATARGGASPLDGPELPDPWGRGDAVFATVADLIEEALAPLVHALAVDGAALGRSGPA